MIDLVKSILTSDAGSFSFVFGLLWAIGYMLYKLGVFMAKQKANTETIEECKAKHQAISDISSENKSLRSDLGRNTERIDNKLDALSVDITYIKTTLTLMQNSKVGNPLTQAHSPISLTDKGREVAESMHIEDIINRNWSGIKAFIDNNIKEKSAYDIQQLCIETATAFPEKLLSKEDLEGVKNFAFLQGNPIAYYGSMIGVIIRDRYFAETGLNINDIDNVKPPIL